MKRLLHWVMAATLTFCGAMMLTSCTDVTGQADNPVQPVDPAAELAQETFDHEVWMDRTVKPGDSFWEFALGSWIKNHDASDAGPHENAIPLQSKLLESHLADYDSPVAGHVLKLIHAPVDKDAEKAFVLSCIDQLKRGEGLTKADIIRNAGLMADMKCSALWAHYISNVNGTLRQTLMPGFPTYITIWPVMVEDGSYETAKSLLKIFLDKDASDPEVDAQCKAIAQIEITLYNILFNSTAETGLMGEGLRYPTSTPVRADQFVCRALTRTDADGEDLQAVFREAFHIDENTYILPEVEKIFALIDKYEVPVLQAYLEYELVSHLALSMMSGSNGPVNLYNTLASVTPSLFLDYHKAILLKDADVEGARQLLEQVRKQMALHIEGVDWMSNATKQKALEKLQAMVINVGAPEKLFNAGFKLTGKTVPEDFQQYNIQLVEYMLKTLAGSATKDHAWEMFLVNPFGKGVDYVNAAYMPITNQIFIMPAFLKGELFPADKNSAARYAAAYVFGHEMTHGFDKNGARYDANGAENDWWTAADRQAFEEKQKQLIARFNELDQLPGVKADGEKTLDENIADLGGMALAYDLWNAKLLADGLSGEALRHQQRQFFLSYADFSRKNETEESLQKQLTSDKHSAYHNRVNGIARLTDGWYDLFGVKPGDKLYVAPKDRVKIW